MAASASQLLQNLQHTIGLLPSSPKRPLFGGFGNSLPELTSIDTSVEGTQRCIRPFVGPSDRIIKMTQAQERWVPTPLLTLDRGSSRRDRGATSLCRRSRNISSGALPRLKSLMMFAQSGVPDAKGNCD
jgi:hypothetical protein